MSRELQLYCVSDGVLIKIIVSIYGLGLPNNVSIQIFGQYDLYLTWSGILGSKETVKSEKYFSWYTLKGSLLIPTYSTRNRTSSAWWTSKFRLHIAWKAGNRVHNKYTALNFEVLFFFYIRKIFCTSIALSYWYEHSWTLCLRNEYKARKTVVVAIYICFLHNSTFRCSTGQVRK